MDVAVSPSLKILFGVVREKSGIFCVKGETLLNLVNFSLDLYLVNYRDRHLFCLDLFFQKTSSAPAAPTVCMRTHAGPALTLTRCSRRGIIGTNQMSRLRVLKEALPYSRDCSAQLSLRLPKAFEIQKEGIMFSHDGP